MMGHEVTLNMKTRRKSIPADPYLVLHTFPLTVLVDPVIRAKIETCNEISCTDSILIEYSSFYFVLTDHK